MLLQHAQQVHLSTVQVIPIFGPVTRHLQLIMIQIGYTSSIFTSCCDMRFLPGASSTPMLCQSDGEEQPQVNYSAKAELETHQTWIFLLQHDPTFCRLQVPYFKTKLDIRPVVDHTVRVALWSWWKNVYRCRIPHFYLKLPCKIKCSEPW